MEYYWQHMRSEEYKTVRDCRECVWNKPFEKLMRQLQIFVRNGPPQFVMMDILGPPPKTSRSIQIVLVMTDHYYKLTIAVPTSKMTAGQIISISADHWTILYEILHLGLKDNKTLFICKFFESPCAILGI